ncbi:MAG: M20/M25/M40 family metallo-hydrolase [Parvularculaceae bacterium]
MNSAMSGAFCAFSLLLFGAGVADAQEEPIDYDMVNRIMDEGFNRSHVMETLTRLTDDIGPRLTNSPGMRKAAGWTHDEFARYGLKNAHLERFPFGLGWSYDSITIHMTAPRRAQLQAMPNAWHPGTNGALEAEAILAPMSEEEDFEKFKGKLKGKIVLVSAAREQNEPSSPIFRRLSRDDLAEREVFPIPDNPSRAQGGFGKFLLFQEDLQRFLEEEGALAKVSRSRREAGLLSAEAYLYRKDNAPKIPGVTVASEDYDRMARLIDRGEKISLALNVDATLYDDDLMAANVIAEIPGRGSRPEIVMAGAHLDSWFMGDGAVDNGAGSAVVLEAARILSALKVRPKRTIRFALWAGEEQGLYGSMHHVEAHFASRPDTDDEERKRLPKYDWFNAVWPITPGRDYQRFSAYFNIDNGSGRIRGIYGEGNPALEPIFERWFEPFNELGAATVVLRGTGGTDHLPFQAVGLPGFQFIQDPLDYGSRLHHTDIDTASHVYEKDMKQAAVILASFLWHAANRDERLPRMPMPTEPDYPPEKEKDDKGADGD